MPDRVIRRNARGRIPQPPDKLILFAAMGGLAHRKIFPALYHMVEHGRLDDPVIGAARAGRNNEHRKERVGDSGQQHVKRVDRQTGAGRLLRSAHTFCRVEASCGLAIDSPIFPKTPHKHHG